MLLKFVVLITFTTCLWHQYDSEFVTMVPYIVRCITNFLVRVNVAVLYMRTVLCFCLQRFC